MVFKGQAFGFQNDDRGKELTAESSQSVYAPGTFPYPYLLPLSRAQIKPCDCFISHNPLHALRHTFPGRKYYISAAEYIAQHGVRLIKPWHGSHEKRRIEDCPTTHSPPTSRPATDWHCCLWASIDRHTLGRRTILHDWFDNKSILTKAPPIFFCEPLSSMWVYLFYVIIQFGPRGHSGDNSISWLLWAEYIPTPSYIV